MGKSTWSGGDGSISALELEPGCTWAGEGSGEDDSFQHLPGGWKIPREIGWVVT